jgi:ketosteroid isomerase-like protein
MTYYQRSKELFKMIEEGKLLDALDKYYHDDVEIFAEDGKTRKGIKQAREYDQKFLKEIEEVIGGGVETITSDEFRAITMVEFWIKLKFKNGNKKTLREVAIQYWKKDRVIKENFYSKR